MKKADIELSHHQGHRGDPAINVKNSLWVPDLIRQYRTEGHDFSGDEAFWEWVDELYDAQEHEAFDAADEMARESCWELAQEYAEEVWPYYTTVMIDEKRYFPEFPEGCRYRFTGEKVAQRKPKIKVWSAGRSGGWLVVDGLHDVESWDAIDLGRWAKFNKLIRGLADEGYPYEFIWHLHAVWELNVAEPAAEAEQWVDALSTLA